MRTWLTGSALLFMIATIGVVTGRSVQEQESTASVADLARQAKTERAKNPRQPVKVFTNDNLPARPPESASTVAANTKATPEASNQGSGSESSPKLNSYRKAMGDLRAKLETHQRQLEVLQQKLGQNNVQFYPDPNKTLNQEFTRADINKLNQDIETKKQQVAADQKAIEDLQDQLRREGVDPGVVRELMSAPIPPPGQPGSTETVQIPKAETEANPEDKKKTKDYWQAKFKTVRDQIARAEEQEKLVEDELNLLRIQQARELDPTVQNEVKQKMAAKTSELEAKRAVTAQARQALEKLEAAFRESGAPPEWSKTD